MAGILEVREWFEAAIEAVVPTLRNGERFRISRDSEPLEQAQSRMEVSRLFEVVFEDKARTDRLITGAVEWRTRLVLRIGYVGFQDARELLVRVDQDFEEIDAALITIGQTGLPANLCDFEADAGPELTFSDDGANFATAERSFSIIYQVDVP